MVGEGRGWRATKDTDQLKEGRVKRRWQGGAGRRGGAGGVVLYKYKMQSPDISYTLPCWRVVSKHSSSSNIGTFCLFLARRKEVFQLISSFLFFFFFISGCQIFDDKYLINIQPYLTPLSSFTNTPSCSQLQKN